MGELAPVIPSALGGGALVIVIGYLLKHLSGTYRQLGEAQANSTLSATERAVRAEAEVANLRIEVAELRQAVRDIEAQWARRASAVQEVRRAHPEEGAKHRWVEARIDEILHGGDDPR